MTGPELKLGCRKRGAVEEDVFSCLTFSHTTAEMESDCWHASLLKEGSETILSGPYVDSHRSHDRASDGQRRRDANITADGIDDVSVVPKKMK